MTALEEAASYALLALEEESAAYPDELHHVELAIRLLTAAGITSALARKAPGGPLAAPDTQTAEAGDLIARFGGGATHVYWLAAPDTQAPSEPTLLREFKGSTEDALRIALRMLYDDTADYIMRNKLGGMENHAMRLAREALAAPSETTARPGSGHPITPISPPSSGGSSKGQA